MTASTPATPDPRVERAHARLDVLTDCDLGENSLPCDECLADRQLADDVLALAAELADTRKALQWIARGDVVEAEVIARAVLAGEDTT